MTALIQLLLWISLAAAGFFSCSMPALAHSPYFTQIEKIALPGGEIGEIRLIHGDGILDVDPVRAMIFNAEGKALARTHKTVPMVIVCATDHRCHAFDFKTNTILEPDYATFGDRFAVYDNWNFETGTEAWGFSARPATRSEIADANFVFAKDHKSYFAVPFILAAGLVGVVFWRLLHPLSPGRFKRVRRVAIIALRFAIAVFLFAGSLFWVWLSGITGEQWLSVSAAGCVTMLALMYLLRQLRARQAAA